CCTRRRGPRGSRSRRRERGAGSARWFASQPPRRAGRGPARVPVRGARGAGYERGATPLLPRAAAPRHHAGLALTAESPLRVRPLLIALATSLCTAALAASCADESSETTKNFVLSDPKLSVPAKAEPASMLRVEVTGVNTGDAPIRKGDVEFLFQGDEGWTGA